MRMDVKSRQKRKRKPRGRQAQLGMIAVWLAVGGLTGGSLSTANYGGRVSVTSDGPTSCVVLKASP
jgi:hypothetical protein